MPFTMQVWRQSAIQILHYYTCNYHYHVKYDHFTPAAYGNKVYLKNMGVDHASYHIVHIA
jgi:hypothetical protein